MYILCTYTNIYVCIYERNIYIYIYMHTYIYIYMLLPAVTSNLLSIQVTSDARAGVLLPAFLRPPIHTRTAVRSSRRPHPRPQGPLHRRHQAWHYHSGGASLYIYIYVHMYICVYMYANMCIYVYHVYGCMTLALSTSSWGLPQWRCVFLFTCKYVYMRISVCIHVYICVHIYMAA